MIDPTLRDRAVQLYDAFTHEHHDRRRLLKQMTALAGSVAAAEAMIVGIGASPAAAALSDARDPRLKIRKGAYKIEGGKTLTGYFAAPRAGRPRGKKLGAVMVIHENRGLTPHIEDVARRLALEGFFVVAPDLLSDQGGTPADENAAREAIGRANYDAVLAEGVGTLKRLATMPVTSGRAGAVGFCWGGGYVNRLAITAGPALAAGVAYYGPAPSPSEATRVSAPLMLHYAGKDARVNATGTPWVAALKAADKTVEAFTYEGVDHAFNNDSSAERYDAAAAKLAWDRTVAFLHARLDG